MPTNKTSRPIRTLARAFLALGLLCVVMTGLVMALGAVSGWLADPVLGPLFWIVNVAVSFVLSAGILWAGLRLIGFRAWWIAPLVGFAVMFAIAFYITTQGGHSYPELRTSHWIRGRATMIDGQLTAYGQSLYGLEAATRNGLLFGTIGAVIGFILGRIAYRHRASPITEPNS